MKKYFLGSALAAGVLLAGLLAGYWHFAGIMPPRDGGEGVVAERPSPRPPARPGEQAVDVPAASEVEEAGAEAEPVAAEGPAIAEGPRFEILRVEPDGAALIAGYAEPSSEVVIRSGGEVIARETASAAGDFVITLNEPLAIGDHALQLETTGADGAAAVSEETAIVSIPPRGREDELLVVVEAPDAPTRLMTVPSVSEEATALEKAAETAPSPAAAEPDMMIAAGQPAVSPATQESALGGELRAGIETRAPEVEAAPAVEEAEPSSELAIAAVEIENDRFYVAGTSAPDSTVRVYLDDKFIAETTGEPGEAFVAEARAEVPVGEHVVRADQIDRDGQVVARVEVPFVRPEGASMAALAPSVGRAAPSVTPDEPITSEEAAAETADALQEERAEPAASTSPVEAPPTVTAARTQEALEPVEGRVIIRRGDTLWRISREAYGRGSRYTVIYLANGDQIRNPDLIYPGQIFRMPDASEAGGASAVN